jgi:V/A-type H+/Na+-transporting ATPase subunit E
MGSEELLAALRSEAEEKTRIIRQEAAAETARLKAEAAAGLARLGEKLLQEQARTIAAEESAILAEAERSARRTRLAAAEKLAEKLYELARKLLPRLREKEYPRIFSLLAAELPPIEWQTLRVNPADAERAADLFPRALIVPDSAICGGMEALADEGRIRVINTLEKRLERGWPELLPVLIEETEQCVN